MLTSQLPNMNVAIVPFGAIMISLGKRGLCPPGLGNSKYHEMSRALYNCLRSGIIPVAATRLNSVARMVGNNSGNGYDLLWNILVLTLPVFDPMVRAHFPSWEDQDRCVHKFADASLLYYQLQKKRGERFSFREMSLQYLRGITEPSYMGIITGLQTSVISSVIDELPDDLQISSLATRIHQTMSNFEIPNPRINSMQRYDGTPAPSDFQPIGEYDDDDYEMQDDPSAKMQDGVVNNLRRPIGTRPGDRFGRTSNTRDRGSDRGGRGGNDRQRRPNAQNKDMQCHACGAFGHGARQCKGLARTLRILKYAGANKALCDQLLKEWEANKDPGGRKMLSRYLEAYNFSAADVFSQMDWNTLDAEDIAEVKSLTFAPM